MRFENNKGTVWMLATVAAVAGTTVLSAVGQTPTFTGVGQLSGGASSQCIEVSPEGSMVVGEAANSVGETVAVSYDRLAGTPTLQALGFLDATYRESKARGVGIDSTSTVHISGTSKNASNNNQAFHWSGDRAGVGSFVAINFLPAGTWATGQGLYIVDDTVYITGESESSTSYTGKGEAFRYRSDIPSVLALGYLNGTNHWSRGYDIGDLGGSETVIAGLSWSRWDGGANSREAFRWTSGNGGHMSGQKGLDWICGGEQWQYAAGDNGVADTTANADNIQVVPPGTTGLDPHDIVISAGPDNQLKGQLSAGGDDIDWPIGHSPDGSESLFRAVSANGRYLVGRAYYPDGGTLFEACLRDMKNRDYTDPDNCGGIAFHWPLGFLDGDNYSEALGVSNGGGPGGREGLVVVGFSAAVPPGGEASHRAFVCFIEGGLDKWFLKHQGAAEGENGASAASRFKDMKDLKAWLVSKGIDMTGWELREATGVSDDGTVIVGWGMHNDVKEGFVVTIEPPPPPGACCVQTGWGSGTCTVIEEALCTEGTWLGPYTSCDECEFCPNPFADTDRDLDVDQDDFGVLQACITGVGGGVLPGCECFNRDGDNDVDEDDYGAFEDCASGPGIAADPLCDDPA